MDLFDVGVMTLRSVSMSIFDIFFVLTIITGYLMMIRFISFNVYTKKSMKNARDMMVEFIVQGIVMGVVLSLMIVFLGIPIQYSEYIYFLLPLSFILGYFHIKYTNITYSALILAMNSLAFSGQKVFGWTLPNVDVYIPGLMGIVAILQVVEGILLLLLRNKPMVPIVAKKDKDIILGFALQRFWPIPVGILVVATATASGESVPMPNWWPLLGNGFVDAVGLIMFVVPLLFILTHGSITFTRSPVNHMRKEATWMLGSGGLLLLGAFLLDYIQGYFYFGVILLAVVAFLPDWIKDRYEEQSLPIFPKEKYGVRVVHVEDESIPRGFGVVAGDLIVQINDIKVTNLFQMKGILKDRHGYYRMIVKNVLGEEKKITFSKGELSERGIGMTFLPDEPEKIFSYERIKKMGMMHLIKFRRM